MHAGLEACLFKYISVAAFRIYALRGEEVASCEKGRLETLHALNSHGNYIVDY